MKIGLLTISFILIPMLASANEVNIDDDCSNNGVGRVILEKNLVNGMNMLTQAMMSPDYGKNVIYVIRYDFILGENIIIPDNCVLEFDGGSISAGNGARNIVTGRNTSINAGLTKIFSTDIILEGTWKVEYGYPEWFGAKGDVSNDDTNAFYSALSNFNSIFLSGNYSIDFKDIILENKAIVGKWRTKSGITQRNSNVPFALVKTYNLINRLTFYAQNNTQITDLLHFGYSNGNYNEFSFTDITNTVFTTNNKTIPLHFNMQYGGNSDLLVDNVRMYNCYIGVWFEFHKTYSNNFGWLTQSTMKDVTIYNPSYYGFKWDALSMYDQGESINGQTVQTMWCYNNYFENIGIDITQDGATGFYIGQGMGMLVNPMVFNDIPDTQPNAVGYSVEFAPIGSPIRSKMVTNIIGGTFEGQVKNIDYAYMNNISNLKLSFRNNRGTIDKYITLDSSSIPDAYDFNIFGKDILNIFSIKNATLSVGHDEVGEYLKVTRIDSTKEFYIGGGPTKQEIMDNGVKNGLYTLQILAQSNLGKYGTGFYFTPSEYRYVIDGKSHENIVMGKFVESIGNNVFVNITDKTSEKLTFGYYGKANSDLIWVKIYSIRLMPGIVGKYMMEKPKSPTKENILISKTYSIGDGSLNCSATFNTIKEVVNNEMPLKVQCIGNIPPGTTGTAVIIGKLQCYNVPRKIWFQIYDAETGTVVGKCSVETDGTFKYLYTNENDKMISVYGSS